MWRTTLKSVSAHKRRLLATCLAVMFGVAFLSATLVVGDTMTAGFSDIFAESNAGTDAVVRIPNNLFVQKYSRVRREGHAPDPSRDSSIPFFTITPGLFSAYKPTVKGKRPERPPDT